MSPIGVIVIYSACVGDVMKPINNSVSVKPKDSKVLDSGPLERLFTGNATAKIIDFLITASVGDDWDYSETDIAKNAGVSKRTIQREISKLLDSRLIKQKRIVGNAKMYQLNKPYRTALSAEKFAFDLASENIERKMQRQMVKQQQQRLAPKLKTRL